MLSSHSASTSVSRTIEDESRLEDFQCLLEVLQALTVTPSITDAAIKPGSPLKVCLTLESLLCNYSMPQSIEEVPGILQTDLPWLQTGVNSSIQMSLIKVDD